MRHPRNNNPDSSRANFRTTLTPGGFRPKLISTISPQIFTASSIIEALTAQDTGTAIHVHDRCILRYIFWGTMQNGHFGRTTLYYIYKEPNMFSSADCGNHRGQCCHQVSRKASSLVAGRIRAWYSNATWRPQQKGVQDRDTWRRLIQEAQSQKSFAALLAIYVFSKFTETLRRFRKLICIFSSVLDAKKYIYIYMQDLQRSQ